MHICLVNLPRYEIHRPPLSLATLSEICNQEQVDYNCIDLSLLIWQKLTEDFETIDNYCITRQIKFGTLEKLKTLIDSVVKQQIDQYPDTVFALSLLSVWSQPVCELMCASIKSQSNCKVLLGGQGLANQSWTQTQIDQKLIDYYIVNEAEIAFRTWLKGECGPGINNYNFEQIDDLDQHVVIPDYRKLPIDQYPYLEQPNFFITASRGCVRNCAYCDIGHQWKKYRYRSAQSVFDEMTTQFERHGVTDFFFTDSLINGSMKMLNELCDLLINYKSLYPHAQFKWQGQYIFRPKSTINASHIKKMVDAGLNFLIVGLETGSDHVRFDMNKKHTTDDAEWFLEEFKKHKLQCRLLMLTGWINETEQDHQDTLKLFSRWQKYVASGTIAGIELGSTLSILEHAPVGMQVPELGISMLGEKGYLWFNPKNPDLTIAERFRRRVETHRQAIKYHWPITRSLYRLSTIKSNLLEAIDYLSTNGKKQKTFPIYIE
jgi:hypothetical protein